MKKIFSLSAVALVIFAGSFSLLWASEGDIRVKAEVDKAFLTIGDPVTYTVTIEHAPDVQILSSIPAPDAEIFEVKKSEEINLKSGKRLITGKKFILTTYRLGEFILDPVTIHYQKNKGPEAAIETNRLYLTVKSVAEGETKQDIRDIKSVVLLPSQIWKLALLVFSVFLIFLAFWFVRMLRKKNIQPEIPMTPLSPEAEALQALQELFDSDLLRRGLIKAYYLRLSEILRVFFEKRYGILAVESTTTETLHALRSHHLKSELYEKIRCVLESSDLAKFAKWVPSPTEVISLNKKSQEIVEASATMPEEAPHAV